MIESLMDVIYNVRPDEVYNLAAQSHVRVSFDMPEYTGDVTGLGTVRILEAIRRSGNPERFYQASSSEMFGGAKPPQKEETAFEPRSPYAAAKVYSYWVTRNYQTVFFSITNHHAVVKPLSHEKSPARWLPLKPASRASCILAIWIRNETGVMHPSMLKRCG